MAAPSGLAHLASHGALYGFGGSGGSAEHDARDIVQTVRELVDNAGDAGPTHIEVTMGCGQRHQLELTVTDDGHGIPPPLERVFAPFATTKGDPSAAAAPAAAAAAAAAPTFGRFGIGLSAVLARSWQRVGAPVHVRSAAAGEGSLLHQVGVSVDAQGAVRCVQTAAPSADKPAGMVSGTSVTVVLPGSPAALALARPRVLDYFTRVGVLPRPYSLGVWWAAAAAAANGDGDDAAAAGAAGEQPAATSVYECPSWAGPAGAAAGHASRDGRLLHGIEVRVCSPCCCLASPLAASLSSSLIGTPAPPTPSASLGPPTPDHRSTVDCDRNAAVRGRAGHRDCDFVRRCGGGERRRGLRRR